MLIYFPAKNYPEPVAAREFLKSCVITSCALMGIKPHIDNDRHVRRGLKVKLSPNADLFRLPSGRLKRGAEVDYAARSWKGKLMTNHLCWHGHRDFMLGLFDLAPDACIRTKLAHYKGKDNFLSQYKSTYYVNDCDCSIRR